MALSNWDDWSVDDKGKSCSGEFTSNAGVRIAVYKNWLYVYDEKAWEENSGFAKPVIMNIDEGHLQYKDVHIVAIRGPQEGVFAAVWSGYEHLDNFKGMIGCGVYGYNGSEWVGVKQETLRWFEGKLGEIGGDIPGILASALSKGLT